MFERIRRSQVIEKSHDLWRIQGVDTRYVFKRLDFSSVAEIREQLRRVQGDGLELYDVAVALIISIWPCLGEVEKTNAEYAIHQWNSTRLVTPQIFSEFIMRCPASEC